MYGYESFRTRDFDGRGYQSGDWILESERIRQETYRLESRGREWDAAFRSYGRNLSESAREQYFDKEKRLMLEVSAEGKWCNLPIVSADPTVMARLHGRFEDLASLTFFCRSNSVYYFGEDERERIRSGILICRTISSSGRELWEVYRSDDLVGDADKLFGKDHQSQLQDRFNKRNEDGLLSRLIQRVVGGLDNVLSYQVSICFTDRDKDRVLDQLQFPSARELVDDEVLRKIVNGEQCEFALIRKTNWQIWLEQVVDSGALGVGHWQEYRYRF